jgi:predicted DNA binding CopG/RHH family protein
MIELTSEEQSLLDSFERGEWQSKGQLADRTPELQEYARYTLESQKDLHLVISENDFEALQVLALAEGISYQSLSEEYLA